MSTRYDVLIVEDSPTTSRLLQAWLDAESIKSRTVETIKEARAALLEDTPTLAVVDLGLPDGSGMDVLEDIARSEIPIYPIILTGDGSISSAVDAMRAGARDFIVKPPNKTRFQVSVRNGLENRRLLNDVSSLKQSLGQGRFHGFIGSSAAMQSVYSITRAAAASKATVFVTGESGTGKELTAEAVHRQSPRKSGPFVAINCGAIPRDLMESEIFGHVKGAFTGATADRIGAAELADGGTLFLDEICEMDLDLQVKLLRFIQTGGFQKVGASGVETVDVRFVCATNRDPWQEVQAGRFREDLYYRLHVIPIELPPLRERGEDCMEIANHLLAAISEEEGKAFESFAPDAAAMIAAYDWPGNVRQLQNIIRNVVVLHDGPTVTADMLPTPLDKPGCARATAAPTPSAARPESDHQTTDDQRALHRSGPDTMRPLWRVEKDAIEGTIEACGGNIQQAARILEISPSTIYRKKLSWEEN